MGVVAQHAVVTPFGNVRGLILMAAEGMANKRHRPSSWASTRTRWGAGGPATRRRGRRRSSRSGRAAPTTAGRTPGRQAALRARVIEATTQTVPEDATHWSCRSMARHLRHDAQLRQPGDGGRTAFCRT